MYVRFGIRLHRTRRAGSRRFCHAWSPQLEEFDCQSTLLASGDSRCAGELVPVVPIALREAMAARSVTEHVYYEQHQLREAIERASGYDLIHSHVGPGAYVLSAVAPSVLHTQHSPVYGDLIWFAKHHPNVWFSTVSQFQAQKLGRASRCEAIHNGIDVSSYMFSADGGEGLVFIGRIEEAKGPDLAIDVANALGLPLTLAGPVVDKHFFAEKNSATSRVGCPLRRRAQSPGERLAVVPKQVRRSAIPWRRALWSRDGRGHGVRHTRGVPAKRCRRRGH